MTAALLVEQHCNECGRGMPKAHKIYHGRRFCSTCYPRVFCRRNCPRCSLPARLPKADSQAVCTKCELDVPCIRCGKSEYEIGKVTQYGPVCGSCAVYFRAPKGPVTSERQDGLTASASDALVPNGDRRATCSSCRRHRTVATSINGTVLCKACADLGAIPCPSCKKSMPAGRGSQCEDCYWRETFFKRLAIDEAGLGSKKVAFAFKAFGTWLIQTVPSQKAALSIHRYFPFFFEVDAVWGEFPTYERLLGQFGAEGLRRVRLPMRWLVETRMVIVDATLRDENSEVRRIEAIGAALREGSIQAGIMEAFKADLDSRCTLNKMKTKSVRMALQPAAALLTMCEQEGVSIPDQATLNRYLAKVPGQRAAVTTFVTFINTLYGAGISVEKTAQAKMKVRKRLEGRLMTLAATASEKPQFRRQWFSVSLAYFHGLPLSAGKVAEDENVGVLPDGNFSIIVNGRDYWIPHWNFHASRAPQVSRRF